MNEKDAINILSRIRDQHLQFLSGDYTNSDNEWYTSYLSEAWACDFGVKAINEAIHKITVDKDVIRKSIQHYGVDNQSTVCMEECAELIQAISKTKRGKLNTDNLKEEIADVLICIEMLKQMYHISDVDIDMWIRKKQSREQERMKEDGC